MVNIEDFRNLGNDIMRRNRKSGSMSKLEDLRFRSHFGTSLIVCLDLWNMIDPIEGGKPFHLLWALMLLKLYCAESVLCSLAGGVHEQTFRKWAWLYVEEISNLQYRVILWSNRFNDDIGNVCLVSVDGTDFRIYQWAPFWTGWFSHKFRGPGLRYEVGLCIRTGDIVWIHGPFPCGKWPDIKIFRKALKHMLSEGEKVQADNGYRGEPNHIVAAEDSDDKVGKAVRTRQETVNKRFKQFNILHRCFRHEVQKHQPAFGAVAVITQLSIERGEPLYTVDYDESKIE